LVTYTYIPPTAPPRSPMFLVKLQLEDEF